MLCCCEKCIKSVGFTFLISGLLFLLRDLGILEFNIEGWTAAFLIVGATYLMHTSCRDYTKTGKKKK